MAKRIEWFMATSDSFDKAFFGLVVGFGLGSVAVLVALAL